MSKIDYSRKIILHPKGEKRSEILLSSLTIPDLWHLAQHVQDTYDRTHVVIEKLDKIIDDVENREVRNKLDQLLSILRGEKKIKDDIENKEGAQAREKIIDIWRLAHDLKLNLAGDTEPK